MTTDQTSEELGTSELPAGDLSSIPFHPSASRRQISKHRRSYSLRGAPEGTRRRAADWVTGGGGGGVCEIDWTEKSNLMCQSAWDGVNTERERKKRGNPGGGQTAAASGVASRQRHAETSRNKVKMLSSPPRAPPVFARVWDRKSDKETSRSKENLRLHNSRLR